MITIQVPPNADYPNGLVPVATMEQLVAWNFARSEVRFRSPASGIMYVIPRFDFPSQDPTQAMTLYPFLQQQPDGTISTMFIPTKGMELVKTTLNAQNPNMQYASFPSGSPDVARVLPGLVGFYETGAFILGPRWCQIAFVSLERQISPTTARSREDLRPRLLANVEQSKERPPNPTYCAEAMYQFLQFESEAPAQPISLLPNIEVYRPPTQQVQIQNSEMISRIDNFIKSNRCGSKSGTSTRLDTLVKKIQEIQNDPAKSENKYLNISTCHFGMTASKNLVRRVGSIVPGTNPPRNLAMQIDHNDLKSIITGRDDADRLDETKYAAEFDLVFKRIEDTIFKEMGTTTRNVEEVGAVPVPLSILDSIPSGRVPAKRIDIVPKSSFVEVLPLSGVTIVGELPISDGKRCVPKLSSKKKGIEHITQENLSKQFDMYSYLKSMENSSPAAIPITMPRNNVLGSLLENSNVEAVESVKIPLAKTEVIPLTQALKPVTFDVALLNRHVPEDVAIEEQYQAEEDVQDEEDVGTDFLGPAE